MKVTLCFKHTIEKDKSIIKKINASLVKFWTNSKYYHIEIIVDNKWISSNTESGVHILDNVNLDDTNFDFIEIEVPELSAKQKKLFWNFIDNQKETGYDWFGIFASQFLFLDNESEDKWFCSEIVSKVLQLLYHPDFLDLKPSRNSPGSIFKKLNIKKAK